MPWDTGRRSARRRRPGGRGAGPCRRARVPAADHSPLLAALASCDRVVPLFVHNRAVERQLC
ncbi:hypothetical protein AB0940_25195 [Streptomyces sp. NPDC006656]|uniref:hypothetical protein n=1 Tax=unclassified Streptomyces TaxID=2593676 RepID=UPI0033E5B71D